jgi:hypothetical protein
LLLRKEERGILKSLVLEVLKEWLRHNITYLEVNTSNQSIKCNKHVLYECIEKRGSDSKNFSIRITEFGVVVGKI